MPTFLKLCQRLHQDVGAAGSIPTVVGQVGMLKRIVDYIAKANRKIQLRQTNWDFLWSEWDLVLIDGVSEYAKPDGLGAFDQTSFWVNAKTIDAIKLEYIDFKEWREFYQHTYTELDQPAFVAIKPNGMIAILPAPDSDSAGLTVTADYWRSPVDLVDNDQISLIPEQFHDAIISQAKQYFAAKAHDSGLFSSAQQEHEFTYAELKAHSLPGQSEERKSESSLFRSIRVD